MYQLLKASLCCFIFTTLLVSTRCGSLKPVTTSISCPSHLIDTRCFSLRVPLDHARPSKSSRISILYAIVTPGPSVGSQDVALVLVPGGPGAGSMNEKPQQLATASTAAFLQRPIIIFDPRGTGNETRLDCRAFFGKRSPYIKDQFQTLRDCLTEIGNEVRHYSARAMANDIEMIRQTVGVSKLDLFGISYGTLISQVYAVTYPSKVRSLILDSPVPLGNRDVFDTRHLLAYKRIYALKDPSFSLVNLDIVLNNLRKNDDDPLTVDVPRTSFKYSRYPLTSRTFFEAFATIPNGMTTAINIAVQTGNYTQLKNIFRSSLLNTNLPPLRSTLYARALALIANCNDLVPILPWKFKVRRQKWRIGQWRQALRERAVVRSRYAPFWPLEAYPVFTRLCIAFPYSQLWSEGRPINGKIPSGIKSVVLVGDEDHITPVEDVEYLDKELRKNVAVVKGAGHSIVENTCGLGLINEFLLTLSVSNISACA